MNTLICSHYGRNKEGRCSDLVDVELVSRNLSRRTKHMRDLGVHGRVESIGSDIVVERCIEFTLRQVIQVIIDIGNHIISDENWEEPKRSRKIFGKLGTYRVISKDGEE
jgi:uncharacterized protein YutE (UPF0331/DUF86 family)